MGLYPRVLISNRNYFLVLQVDGPITGGRGAYKRQFTVWLSMCLLAVLDSQGINQR